MLNDSKTDKLLEDAHIKLRAPEPEDLEVLFLWENDTDVWRYGSAISPYSRYLLKQYIADAQVDVFQSKQLRFMIVLAEENVAIGTVDLYDFDPINSRAGVGIYIDCAYRKKHYATRALLLLERYVFEFLKINQLYAIIPETNNASLRLFLQSNFIKAGVLYQWISGDNRFEDAIIVQKIKEQ